MQRGGVWKGVELSCVVPVSYGWLAGLREEGAAAG